MWLRLFPTRSQKHWSLKEGQGLSPGGLKMSSFHDEYCLALLHPLAWHLLQLLRQLQGELSRGCSWLSEGRTSLPFPLLKKVKGTVVRKRGLRPRSLPWVCATDGVPSPPATPDEVACVTAATSPTCTFLGRLKCVWLQMNVFKCI